MISKVILTAFVLSASLVLLPASAASRGVGVEDSMGAGAEGCSLAGGEVTVSSFLGMWGFGVPVNECNEDFDGKTGEFGDNCVTVEAVLVPTVGPVLSDTAVACATPIDYDCLKDLQMRAACL